MNITVPSNYDTQLVINKFILYKYHFTCIIILHLYLLHIHYISSLYYKYRKPCGEGLN